MVLMENQNGEFGGQALTSAIAEGLKDKMITKLGCRSQGQLGVVTYLAPWMRSLKGADSDYWAGGLYFEFNKRSAGCQSIYEAERI